MDRKINWKRGFKRIIIVIATMYLILVVAVVCHLLPTAKNYQECRVFDTVNLIKKYDQQAFPESEWTYEITNNIMKTGADIWLVHVHEKFGRQVDFSKIESDYQENMNGLIQEQCRMLGEGVLAWAIPVAALYLLGVTIRWVMIGFRGA